MCQHTPVSHACAGNHEVLSGIHLRSGFQQTLPRVGFRIILQLQLSVFDARKREVRIIFRIVDEGARCVSCRQSALRCLGLLFFSEIHVHPLSVFCKVLRFPRNLIYACRDAHAACACHKEDVARMSITHPHDIHPFGRGAQRLRIPGFVRLQVPTAPFHPLLRSSGKLFSLSVTKSGLKESLVGRQHLIAHTRIEHIRHMNVLIVRSGGRVLQVVAQNVKLHIAQILFSHSTQQAECR